MLSLLCDPPLSDTVPTRAATLARGGRRPPREADALRPRDAGIHQNRPVEFVLDAFDDDVSRILVRERNEPAKLVAPDRIALDQR
ncbi:hypothetical protein BvRS1_49610 [Burkholderia vietnamiensis]|nr:hypothetical protein BvRS1_49610 [Burkholderia vietnamiensis]